MNNKKELKQINTVVAAILCIKNQIADNSKTMYELIDKKDVRMDAVFQTASFFVDKEVLNSAFNFLEFESKRGKDFPKLTLLEVMEMPTGDKMNIKTGYAK